MANRRRCYDTCALPHEGDCSRPLSQPKAPATTLRGLWDSRNARFAAQPTNLRGSRKRSPANPLHYGPRETNGRNALRKTGLGVAVGVRVGVAEGVAEGVPVAVAVA